MVFYNNIPIPQFVHASKVISAFENVMDEYSLDWYRQQDVALVTHDNPIRGYPDILDTDDIEAELVFINGDPVTDAHIGGQVWMVTDGHHRSTVGAEQGCNLMVELDYNCIVNREDL